MLLGSRVGKARKESCKECKELAEKEGEDAKQFEYPNMYVSGDSERAMYFNCTCTQRGHQQALETYASFGDSPRFRFVADKTLFKCSRLFVCRWD